MATGPVVVFGGTGHYGRRIVASLVRRGAPVRVVTRNPEAARKVVGEAPAIVEGDIVSENAVAQAIEGARVLVSCVSAASSKLIRRRQQIERDGVLRMLAQAQVAGVARVVYLSAFEMHEGPGNPKGSARNLVPSGCGAPGVRYGAPRRPPGPPPPHPPSYGRRRR